ncbi:PTS sugar transporter subunit IIA [Streptococcus porcorum]|uniref:PTS system mannose-specific IIA component n=1 Tax=Streptococcus porcorum TaxID=701526 RepID=A0ABV2JH39_9STRE
MTKQLVLISHGRFCEALKESTEMIMGPQNQVHTLALLPEEGPDDFRKKFEILTKDFDQFIVMADLLGGTPANVVSKLLLEGGNFDFYVGMNMPMVIGFLNGILLDQEVDLIQYGTSNIKRVNDLLLVADEDDE